MRTRRRKWLYVLITVVVACAALLAAVTTNAADKPNILESWGDEGTPGAEATEDATGEAFAPDAHISLRIPWQSRGNLRLSAVTESSDGEPSASELNRKLTN